MSEPFKLSTRRALLSFFAASPVLYAASRAMGQPAFDIFDPYAPQVISNAQDAINVFDFHEVAKQSLMPGHYTYMALGTDDGGALRANREGFANYQLRMRRLIDTQNVDTSFELFGERYPVPILIAPCGSQKAFHPQDELVTARAARTRGVEQILSTGTSSGVEEVNETRGRPVWFQLYADAEWQVTQALVKRVRGSRLPGARIDGGSAGQQPRGTLPPPPRRQSRMSGLSRTGTPESSVQDPCMRGLNAVV